VAARVSRGRLRLWEDPRPADIAAEPEAFLRALGGPTAIRIRGRDRSRARGVVTLLHGNEPSGLRAVHAWVRSGAIPATDALLVIASIEAALAAPGFSHRMLDGRRDLNRCFAGPFDDAEGALAHAILSALADLAPEAVIDIHNNTGHNPPYGVGPRAGPGERALASLFGRRLVVSDIRLGALTEVLHAQPALTIEVGRSGDDRADAIAQRGLVRYLARPELFAGPVPDVDLFANPIRVCLRETLSVACGDAPVSGCDFTLRADVDRHNFERLAPGTGIGWLRDGSAWPLEARDAAGSERSRDLFAVHGGRLEVLRPMIPIMMTTDPEMALADCLFYAVEPQSGEDN
jgi:hypothetical protein